jgi:hypothetical protein
LISLKRHTEVGVNLQLFAILGKDNDGYGRDSEDQGGDKPRVSAISAKFSFCGNDRGGKGDKNTLKSDQESQQSAHAATQSITGIGDNKE